ncbi:MAG: hypothetical protein FK730_11375 [Asgard group archaeon]|nr:hypothetical protein [Asgard group archaeon]
MLLECLVIDNEGEETKVEPDDMKFTHDTLAIIMSHTNRCIYIFKGLKVSIVQKFASARRASAMRLQHGYKIRHVEEAEGIDEEFKPILAHLGGIVEDEIEKPVEKIQPVKEVEKPIDPKPKTPAPEKTVELKKDTTAPKTTTTKKKTTTKEKDPLFDLTANHPPRTVQVIKSMTTLEPPSDSSCDYVIAGTKLYMIVGDNKTDLRKCEFRLEEVPTLPEGVFPIENYYPRILISKQKVLGVELWTKR